MRMNQLTIWKNIESNKDICKERTKTKNRDWKFLAGSEKRVILMENKMTKLRQIWIRTSFVILDKKIYWNTYSFDQKLKTTKNAKAEKNVKSRNDRKKAEKSSKSRIFLLKAEDVAALDTFVPQTEVFDLTKCINHHNLRATLTYIER
jgi:hypothetical protein